MKRWAAILVMTAWALQGACGQVFLPVLSWECETTEYAEHDETVRRGESAIFEPTFVINGTAIDLGAASNAVLRYTPIDPATNTTHYAVTGTVYNATAGVVRVTWHGYHAGTADYYAYEISVEDNTQALVRAHGILRLEPGVGDSGSGTTEPEELISIDWAATETSNDDQAPFPTDAELDAVENKTNDWNTAYAWGDHGTGGYASASSVLSISQDVDQAEADIDAVENKTNDWNTAYAWGDHGTGGYASASSVLSISNSYVKKAETNAFFSAATNEAAANAAAAHYTKAQSDGRYLDSSANLSDIATPALGRENLGVKIGSGSMSGDVQPFSSNLLALAENGVADINALEGGTNGWNKASTDATAATSDVARIDGALLSVSGQVDQAEADITSLSTGKLDKTGGTITGNVLIDNAGLTVGDTTDPGASNLLVLGSAQVNGPSQFGDITTFATNAAIPTGVNGWVVEGFALGRKYIIGPTGKTNYMEL